MPPFPDFSGLRVLVVGDLMIDRYVSGRVDRISPEAPVPVVRKLGREDRLGGAANVAVNLNALGITAGVAGAVGADDNATHLVSLLDAAGIDRSLIVTDKDRPTTVKTRIVAQTQQLLRIDEESTADLSPGLQQLFLTALSDHLGKVDYDLIILQDYNKGVLNAATIAGVIALASGYGIRTAVDPKFTHFWAYRGGSLFKPNLREIQQQVDFPLTPTVDSLDRAARLIFDRLACQEVMITLSEHGIYTHDGNRSTIHPSQARKIIDVSGAGDTVISVAAAARAAGMSLADAARLANLAGAQVISRPGVVAIEANILQRAWETE